LKLVSLRRKNLVVFSTLILVLSIFGQAQPSEAVNSCSQTQNYDSTSCSFDTEQGRTYGTETIATCDDGYGYQGRDYLQEIYFSSVHGDGQITPGSDLPVAVSMIQDCNPSATTYQFSVSLVSPSGTIYASENMKSSYYLKSRLNAPILSYCSTRACGWAESAGIIRFPASAPLGTYQVKIRITPSNASSVLAAKTFYMKGFLSTSKQPPYIPTAAVQIASSEGIIACYLPDVVPTEATKYAISGTYWKLSVDGRQVDEVANLPLATTDNAQTIQLKHGPLTTRYVEEAKARIYSFIFANQDKGSTYSCSVAFQTANGTGPFTTVSQVSTVKSNGLYAVPEAATPTPIPAKPVFKSISCIKGKILKTVKAVRPVCPKGFKLKSSH